MSIKAPSEEKKFMYKYILTGKKTVLFLGVLILFSVNTAMAQMSFGLRAGASVDPDQFHFGAHIISDPLIPNLTFRPNLEIGLGDGVTAVTANLELAYGIPVPEQEFSVYVGAGPALNVYRFDNPVQQDRDTHLGGGFNILFGLEHHNGLFGEMKVGTIDSPELKFTIGYTFH
jgi:hypothetical protein